MNKTSIIIFVVIFILIAFLPVNIPIKIGMGVAIFAILAFARRATLMFVRANQLRTGSSPKHDKCWDIYKKSIKAGLAEKYQIIVAHLFIVYGDIEYGVQLADQIMARTKDQKTKNTLKSIKSMALWHDGKTEEALELVCEAIEAGAAERTAYVNKGTYLLDLGDMERLGEAVTEAAGFETESPGVLDNKGCYYMMKGDWNRARAIYKEAFDLYPKFPDPYLHNAQVHLHFGEVEDAIKDLRKVGNCEVINITSVDRDFVNDLISQLENEETRDAAIMMVNTHTWEVAAGKKIEDFHWDGTVPVFETPDDDIEDEPEPDTSEEEKIEDLSDKEMDTSITDDDEEWIKNHQDDTLWVRTRNN